MATDATTTQPWHVPEPSPWPIVGTIGALATAFGLIWFMHAGVPWLIYVGGILLIVTMIGWWKDVITEANDGNSHSSPVKVGLRVGFLLFIASEVMFFFAFFWAYFHSSLPILNLVAGPWPPKGIEAIGAAGIPMLNTLLLLTSSLTVTVAHHAILDDDRQKVQGILELTLASNRTATTLWDISFDFGTVAATCVVPAYPVTSQNILYSGSEAKANPTIPATTENRAIAVPRFL